MSANMDLAAQFVEMTGSDPDTAMYFLEMSGFDLESALNLMFSGDIPPPVPSSSTSNTNHFSDSVQNDPFHSFGDYEGDSIRVADPVRQQVLLDPGHSGGMNARMAFSRAEDPSVEWMFSPPHHLSFPGTLAEARATAKNDHKWILVNIQCDKAFSSHLLNRDVWTNDTLVSLIRSNFVFWQRGTTSQDGKMFCSIHGMSTEGANDFPLIGIVDSRTGALISTIRVTATTDANDITLNLMEFLELNNAGSMEAPTVTIRGRLDSRSSGDARSGNKFSNMDEDEDDDEEDILALAAALKASIALPPSKAASSAEASSPSTPASTPAEVAGRISEAGTTKCEQVVETEVSSMCANISLADTAEPEDLAAGIKISLKLVPELVQAIATSSGRKPVPSLVRSFHAQDQSVQHVFAAVHYLLQTHAAALPALCRDRPFDLITAFPRASLGDKRELSVSAAGLKGAQVIMQWL